MLFYSFVFTQSSLTTTEYLNKKSPFKSGDIFNHYVKHYHESNIDSVMKNNSKKLSEINEFDYITHELARVLFYKYTFQMDSAIVLLDALSDQETIKTNLSLNASYETLFGIVCYDLNRPKIARSHYINGLELYSNMMDSIGIKGNLINIGSTYFLEEKFDSAEIYFEQAQVYERLGIQEFHENLTNNLATVYQNTDRYNKAIEYYTLLINEGDQSNTTHYYNLGLVYYKNKDYQKSVQMLETATTIEYDKSNIFLSSVYSALSTSLNKIGETKKAYTALSYADSLKIIEDKESANRLLDELKLNHQEKLFEKEKILSSEKIRHEQKEKLLLRFILGLVTILLLVIVVLFILKSRKNQVLFQKNIELTLANKKTKKPKKENNVSTTLITKLEKLLNEKEAFTNSKLTLEKLAKQLNTNRTYLSENINSHYKMSFSVLINQLRIKKAREMLIDKEFVHYSIEGISDSVGFNSLSTFNTYFKKETGITPSYFRKKGQESL